MGFGDSGFRTAVHKFQKATPDTPRKKNEPKRNQRQINLHQGDRVVAVVDKCADSRESGKGNFATVYEVSPTEEKRAKLALKILKPIVKESHLPFDILRKRAKYEYDIRHRVPEHENLVSYKDLLQASGYVGLTMEFCEGGTLEQFLLKDDLGRSRKNSVGFLIHILVQILNGLSFMHAHNIVHLDLKPDNILLAKPFIPGTIPIIKIGDFGTALDIGSMEILDTEDIETGDPRYAAPETMYGNYRLFDGRADVFSVGVLMVQLITQMEPTDGEKCFPPNFVPYLFESQDEATYHSYLIETVKEMLTKDVNKRPSAAEILKLWQNIPNNLLIDSHLQDFPRLPLSEPREGRLTGSHTRTHSESSSSVSDDKGT